MITMEEHHKPILAAILKKYPYTFYAFGSRVKNTQRKFSDLDLCYVEPIPLAVLSHINEDFEESKLPFKVDMVNWQNTSETFRSLIKKDLRLIQGNDLLHLDPPEKH